MTKYTGIQETMWCELTLHIFTSGKRKWYGINIVQFGRRWNTPEGLISMMFESC